MNLNNDMRQNAQSNLDFSSSPTGETRRAGRGESEPLKAVSAPESLAGTDRTMEEIVERENLKEALRRVKANKGAPGVDGITCGQLDDHLKQHWPAIREQLLEQSHSSCIPVAAGTEPGGRVVWGDGFEGLGDGLVQGFGSTCLGRAQELFELRPGLLDGVQVR